MRYAKLYVCKQPLDGQLTTALAPTVPSLCFLVCSLLQLRNILAFHLSLSAPCMVSCCWSLTVGLAMADPCLVRVVCASPGLFRQFFTNARKRETLWYLIYPSPHCSSGDSVVYTDMVEEIMADLTWFSALFTLFCLLPGISRQPLYHKEERNSLVPCGPYGS